MQNTTLEASLRFMKKPEEAQKIEIAQHFILNNLQGELNITRIATEVGLNTSYLKSGFKAQTGYTICGFIVAKRMQLAHELLGKTNKKLVEIAEIIGYGSLSSFSQAYKNYYGRNPLRDCPHREIKRK